MGDHANGSPLPKERELTVATGATRQTSTPTKDGQPLSVGIDYARYETMLENSDLSDDDKRAVIDSLWNIVSGFVELGFGVHPIQQALDEQNAHPCGQVDKQGACAGEDLVFCAETTNAPVKGGPR